MKLKITGDIIEWNDTISEFQNAMKTIDENEDLEIEINSYGGDVYLGISIANMIRGHKGKTTAIITGIAASAASIISAAADNVKMYTSSQYMVHQAWTIAMGNSKDFRKVAEDLDKIGTSVLASYTHRVDEEEMKRLLDAETYLTAAESLELGLADEIIDAEPKAVQSKAFAKLAKEFNDKLPASSAEDSEELTQLKAQMQSMQNELTQLKSIEPEKPKPVKQNRASRLF